MRLTRENVAKAWKQSLAVLVICVGLEGICLIWGLPLLAKVVGTVMAGALVALVICAYLDDFGDLPYES